MTRKTKALSGASQDAYFRRVFKDCASLTEQDRERLVRRLREDVAHLRIRARAQSAVETAPETTLGPDPGVRPPEPLPDRSDPHPPAKDESATATAAIPAASDTPFDPFALNVIVLLRTAGKQAALDALEAIGVAGHLRLLAREQRLSIAENLETPQELSAAIVAAAERRVANRRAAAGVR